jgi:hypothetical protein
MNYRIIVIFAKAIEFGKSGAKQSSELQAKFEDSRNKAFKSMISILTQVGIEIKLIVFFTDAPSSSLSWINNMIDKQ